MEQLAFGGSSRNSSNRGTTPMKAMQFLPENTGENTGEAADFGVLWAHVKNSLQDYFKNREEQAGYTRTAQVYSRAEKTARIFLTARSREITTPPRSSMATSAFCF
jgi:hypothetical protein